MIATAIATLIRRLARLGKTPARRTSPARMTIYGRPLEERDAG